MSRGKQELAFADDHAP